MYIFFLKKLLFERLVFSLTSKINNPLTPKTLKNPDRKKAKLCKKNIHKITS